MLQTKEKIRIMKFRVPFYYDQFHCITSECKDNCCVGGWEIDIDDDTYDYYMSLEGELGDRIRADITKSEDGSNCFKLIDGHCGLLDDCGLCTIHKELGAEHLSVVCDQFPRYSEYYGEIKESGVGLACEEAEKIIFSENKTFTTVLKPCDEQYLEDDEFDSSYAVKIFKARDEIFRILDMTEMSVNEKLVVILKYCAAMQEYINDDDFDGLKEYVNTFGRSDIEHILMEMNEESDSENFEDVDIQDSIRSIMYSYEDMEVLNTRWEDMLSDIVEIFHDNMDNETYQETEDEFMTAMLEREYEYRNFITYLVFRYFAKSVYDYDVVGKAKMFITNYIILRQMDMLVWYKKNKRFTFDDRIDTVHIFSRQVEYSEDNMEALYESFLFDQVFETDNLCKLIWIDSTAL